MVAVKDEISYIIDQFRDALNISEGEPLPCGYEFCNCETSGVAKTKAPYFYYGTKKEILNRLTEKDKEFNHKDKIKYPAIILEMPFREVAFTEQPDSTLNIFFATGTEVEWTYDKRYEENIKPILYPLIDKFIKAVKTTDNVGAYDFLNKTDSPFYGDGFQMANDYVDLVQIQIRIIFNKNCKNKKICKQ